MDFGAKGIGGEIELFPCLTYHSELDVRVIRICIVTNRANCMCWHMWTICWSLVACVCVCVCVRVCMSAVPCCLCCAVLCCGVLCCAVLCCVVLCCVVLFV